MNQEIFKPEDFILNGKESYISQVKLSELTGIPRGTLQLWINKKLAGYITNENNQLHAKSLGKLLKAGSLKSKAYSDKCGELLDQLLEAGSVVFIYGLAGEEFVTKTTADKMVEDAIHSAELKHKLASLEASTAALTHLKVEILSSDALSAKVLLKRTGAKIGLHKFFDALDGANMLADRKPPVLNDNGLIYGHNLPFGKFALQPRWYHHRFTDLLTHLNIK